MNVLSKSDPLIFTCNSSNELDNLADLIDGYCRGARNPKVGTIIKARFLNCALSSDWLSSDWLDLLANEKLPFGKRF